MSLLDRENTLDNNYRFHSIELIKHGKTSGNMKSVDNYPASKNKFLFLSLTSRERIFSKPLQGSF